MLALQLGTEETTYERPFSLTLYVNDENMNAKKEIYNENTENDIEDDDDGAEKEKSNLNKKKYKSKLESLYCDLEDDSKDIKRSMDLLELLDEV